MCSTHNLKTELDHYEAAGEEIIVPDMHTRKKMMFDQAKGFIALPGGIGTMEELIEIMTWMKLDLHSKPIGLLNIDGYYNHFIEWVSCVSRGDTFNQVCMDVE